jgi:hypothetical protein
MTLKERNDMLRLALDNINYIVTENAGNNPDDVEKQYDCNAFAFDAICKVVANCVRAGLPGNDLPPKTFFTPEAAKKVIDPVFMNPPLEGFAKFLSVPELGIQFRRHKSADMTKLIATWRDDFNDHVYEITVQRDGDSPNCGWRALTTNDGHNVFQLRTKNRSNCEQCAFSAMKRYLKRGHRRTYRTIAKKGGK